METLPKDVIDMTTTDVAYTTLVIAEGSIEAESEQ